MALPSISSLFRNTQQTAPAPSSQPVTPTAPSMAARPLDRGASMPIQNPDAGGPGIAPTDNGSGPQQASSPLDAWSKVWDTPTSDKAPPADPWSQPILPTDPAKLQEAASQMNMMGGISPELMQKVQAGGDSQALMDLINRVAQNTLAMSAQLSAASVERAGTVIRDRSEQTLPDKFRDYQLQNLPVDNPVLNHPGAQGMLKIARQQLKMQNPDWSATRINTEATKYLTSFAQAVTVQDAPQQQSEVDQHGQKMEDWSKFLDN